MAKKKTVRRSDSAKTAKKKKGTKTEKQKNLKDGDGEITAHKRFPDVDKVVDVMFHAKEQAAQWEEDRTDALKKIEQMLVKKGFTGVYYCDWGSSTYKIKITKKSRLSVKKCNKKELEKLAR